jgi:hypothetical protein
MASGAAVAGPMIGCIHVEDACFRVLRRTDKHPTRRAQRRLRAQPGARTTRKRLPGASIRWVCPVRDSGLSGSHSTRIAVGREERLRRKRPKRQGKHGNVDVAAWPLATGAGAGGSVERRGISLGETWKVRGSAWVSRGVGQPLVGQPKTSRHCRAACGKLESPSGVFADAR